MSLQEFKDSFLNSCKQAGLSEAEIDYCIDAALAGSEKSAETGWEFLTGPASSIWEGVKGVGKGLGSAGAAAYVGAPVGLGIAGGAALSALNDADSIDEEDARHQETIDTYRQLAHEMELRAKDRRQTNTRARSQIVR